MRIARGDTLVAVRDCAQSGLTRGTAYLIDSADTDHMDLVDSAGNWLPGVPVGHAALALRVEIRGIPTAYVQVQPQPLGGVTARVVIDLPEYSAATAESALRVFYARLLTVGGVA